MITTRHKPRGKHFLLKIARDTKNHVMLDKTSKSKCLLIYGSQTGQAEAISERIAHGSESWGVEMELLCGDEMEGHMDRLHNQVIYHVSEELSVDV